MDSTIVELSSNSTTNNLITRPAFKIAPSMQQEIELYGGFEQAKGLISSIPKHEIAVRQALTFYNTVTSYSLPTDTITLPNGEVKSVGLNQHLPESVHPIVAADRNKALQTINSLLSTINNIKKDVLEKQEGPICPYERTKLEYLGPDFIAPSIHDLDVPKNFTIDTALKASKSISLGYNNMLLTRLNQMTAEAADPSGNGIKTEALGNAFAVLSTTAKGEEYVVDKHKVALHLEFAELVKSIPVTYIMENPVMVAQKLVTRYIQINYEFLRNSELTPEELSKQSLDFTS